jgi:hypothetical protein
MFVPGMENGAPFGRRFRFPGSKKRGVPLFAPSQEMFDQFTFTMLNTVLFVKPMAAAIALQLSPAW